MELWRLLAHRHWITLRILDKELRLCARCSGLVAGYFLLMTFRKIVGLPFFNSLDFHMQISLCLLLTMPFTSDWLTQSWGLRESNNYLRLLTGAIMGIDVLLFTSLEADPDLKMFLYIYTVAIIVLLGSAGKLLSNSLTLSNDVCRIAPLFYSSQNNKINWLISPNGGFYLAISLIGSRFISSVRRNS